MRDYIPDRDDKGRLVDVSFATQNWQKVIRDRRRPGYFVRRYFEAMVFYYLDVPGPLWASGIALGRRPLVSGGGAGASSGSS